MPDEKLSIYCGSCRYFGKEYNDGWGLCRRYPRIDADTQRVHEDRDWCGEFVAKPPVVAANR